MSRSTVFFVFIMCICLIIAGCASVPPLSFSVPNVGKSTQKIDAEIKSLTVTIARPDEATGEIDVAGIEDQFTNMWKISLQEALDKMLIFNDNSNNKISLSVKVLKMDVPSFGATMTTDAAAKYELVNRKNGDVIFSTTINSQGVCPMNYAFVRSVRARKSGNRAVQNNIIQFLQALESTDISKPMFPSKQQ